MALKTAYKDGKPLTLQGKLVQVEVSEGGGANLSAVEVYVADYNESADLSITAGALDKYARVIVS